jgi:hypothetical protein
LETAPHFGRPWNIVQPPFQWSEDGSRDWEEQVRELYRKGVGTVVAQVDDHQARGELLPGQEIDFVIRCNCENPDGLSRLGSEPTD